jgi:hypothetical protein
MGSERYLIPTSPNAVKDNSFAWQWCFNKSLLAEEIRKTDTLTKLTVNLSNDTTLKVGAQYFRYVCLSAG